MILFLSDAAFLTHGVQMQMLNEILSVYTASVPVILFVEPHY